MSNETTQETKETLAAAVVELFKLTEYNGVPMTADIITDEMFENAMRAPKGKPSLRTAASRIRFSLIGKKKESNVEREMIPDVTGTYVGSRDIASKKAPLGMNKSSSTFFMKKCDDGIFRLFTDPNTPSDFNRVKETLYGKLVTVDMELSPNKFDGFYVSAKNQETVEKNFTIDTSEVEAYDINGIAKLDDYTDSILVGTIRSIRLTKVPPFNQSLVNTEDYPSFIKGSAHFTIMLESEEGEPAVKCMASMRHLSKMFVDVEDYNELMDPEMFDTNESAIKKKITETDAEGEEISRMVTEYNFDSDVVNEMADYMDDEVTPSLFGRRIMFFGTKTRDNDVTKENDDGEDVTTTWVDFEIAGMVDVTGEPKIAEIKTAKEKVKEAKAAKKQAKASKDDPELLERQRVARMEEVGVAITAMKQETTIDIVRKMKPKAFAGVDDATIQGMIDEKMAEMGIEVPAVKAPEEPTEAQTAGVATDEDAPEEPVKKATKSAKPATEKEPVKDLWDEGEDGEE